jgi:uncharacterized protein YbjT (DUF2867 family)
MRVLLFGATGMVGQGVLRECLLADEVTSVVAVGRSASGATDAKLTDLVHQDLLDFSTVKAQLAGFDACFFCLGISSAGMSEADYHRITYDMTLAAARTLVETSPGLTFIYVSGSGTDATEKGRSMWARVKGKTENALLALPFKGAYMFRCGIIQPLHGIRSKTRLYRIGYVIAIPLFPLLKLFAPSYVTTTELVGRAMISVARRGAAKKVLENRDINAEARTQ